LNADDGTHKTSRDVGGFEHTTLYTNPEARYYGIEKISIVATKRWGTRDGNNWPLCNGNECDLYLQGIHTGRNFRALLNLLTKASIFFN
jgi:hypothetical protein